MPKKNPLDFKSKWEEDQWREGIIRRAEEREEYLANLFHLPGRNLDHPDFLIEGLLPAGYLAVLAGDPKVGKTCLATAMAIAIATGTPFAGMKTKQAGVLWLSLEESPQERAQALGTFTDLSLLYEWADPIPSPSRVSPPLAEMREGLGEGDPESPGSSPSTNGQPDQTPNRGGTSKEEGYNEPDDLVFGWPKSSQIPLPIFTCYQPIAIDTEDGLGAIDAWISRARAKLIVVDPLHAAHSGRSLNDGWAARRTLQPLKQLCARRRITALVLHHLGTRNGKPRVAENAQLSAVASMFMLLTQSPFRVSPEMRKGFGDGDPPPAETHLFKLTSSGRGSSVNKTYHFASSSPVSYKIIEVREEEQDSKQTALERAILTALIESGAQTSVQLAETLAYVHSGSVQNAITRLTRAGFIVKLNPNGRKNTYAISSNTPTSSKSGGKTPG